VAVHRCTGHPSASGRAYGYLYGEVNEATKLNEKAIYRRPLCCWHHHTHTVIRTTGLERFELVRVYEDALITDDKVTRLNGWTVFTGEQSIACIGQRGLTNVDATADRP
jgi:hypothetical protein